MPGAGGSSIGNYTLGRPLIGCGLISGQFSEMCTLIAGRAPFKSFISPGNTWYCICRCKCAISTSVFHILLHANNILHAELPQPAPNRCSRWDNRYSSFYGTAIYELAYGNTLVGRPRRRKLQNCRSWLVLPISHFLLFPSNNDYQIRRKHGWFDETIPSYGWLPTSPLTAVPSPMCHLVETNCYRSTDFIPFFFVGFTLAKLLGLNLVSSAVVSLIFAVIVLWTLKLIKSDESCHGVVT